MKKKTAALALAAMILLLSGCTGRFDTMRVSEMYASSTSVNAQVALQTNTGVIIDYILSVEYTGESCTVGILSPESLAGISAKVSAGSAQIIYQDVAVETLLPSISGFTPMDAMPKLIEDLARASPANYSFETYADTACVALTYYKTVEGYQAEKRVWLDRETLCLLAAEFYLDGRMIMQLNCESFQIY